MINLNDVLDRYNNEGVSLSAIAPTYNISKSSLQRFLVKNGYVFDKENRKYVPKDSLSEEKIETLKLNSKEKTVGCTYQLPSSLLKALKLKSVLEEKTMQDIVLEYLRENIEQKYFDISKIS